MLWMTQRLLTFHNDDSVLSHDVIQPIQNLLCSLHLPEALVHGTVLDIDHLSVTQVREGNGIPSGLAWHPSTLLSHLVALQGPFADAPTGKVCQEFRCQWAEVACLRLLNLVDGVLLALRQHCRNKEVALSIALSISLNISLSIAFSVPSVFPSASSSAFPSAFSSAFPSVLPSVFPSTLPLALPWQKPQLEGEWRRLMVGKWCMSLYEWV